MKPHAHHLAEEIAENHANGLLTRRDAVRRLASLGVGAVAASGLLEAATDSASAAEVSALDSPHTRYSSQYGVPTDGTTIDDAAVDAFIQGSSRGDTLVFEGTILVSATVRLAPGRRYVSSGPGAGKQGGTIRQANGANLPAVVASQAWYDNAPSADDPIDLEFLNVDGNKANNVGATTIGIALMSYTSSIDRCYVTGAPGDGILISDRNRAGTLITNKMLEIRVTRSTVYAPGRKGIVGLDTNSAGKITDGYCSQNIVAFAATTAIDIQRSAGWFITNNHVYASGEHGINLGDLWCTYVLGNEVDGFGASATLGTYFGLNMDVHLIGRPSVIATNTVNCNEGSGNAGSSFIYYRLQAAAGAPQRVMLADNVAHKDGTGAGAASTAYSLRARSGGVLLVDWANNVTDGPATSVAADVGRVYVSNAAVTDTSAQPIDNGQETIPRLSAARADTPTANGQLRLTYFTARKTALSTQVRIETGGTGSAGLTLARVGLYEVDGANNLSLVASTSSDATLAGAPNATHVRNWSTGYTPQRGRRYAVGVLFVGTTTPTLVGCTVGDSNLNLTSRAPRMAATLSGQANLPSNVAAASVANTGRLVYAELLP